MVPTVVLHIALDQGDLVSGIAQGDDPATVIVDDQWEPPSKTL